MTLRLTAVFVMLTFVSVQAIADVHETIPVPLPNGSATSDRHSSDELTLELTTDDGDNKSQSGVDLVLESDSEGADAGFESILMDPVAATTTADDVTRPPVSDAPLMLDAFEPEPDTTTEPASSSFGHVVDERTVHVPVRSDRFEEPVILHEPFHQPQDAPLVEFISPPRLDEPEVTDQYAPDLSPFEYAPVTLERVPPPAVDQQVLSNTYPSSQAAYQEPVAPSHRSWRGDAGPRQPARATESRGIEFESTEPYPVESYPAEPYPAEPYPAESLETAPRRAPMMVPETTTYRPAYQRPSYQQPSNVQPSYQQPSSVQPSNVQQATYQRPETLARYPTAIIVSPLNGGQSFVIQPPRGPLKFQLRYNGPPIAVVPVQVIGGPVIGGPVIGGPVIGAPVIGAPAVGGPAVGGPAASQPPPSPRPFVPGRPIRNFVRSIGAY